MGLAAFREETFSGGSGGAAELILSPGSQGEEKREIVGGAEPLGVCDERGAQDGEVVIVSQDVAESLELAGALFQHGRPEVAEESDVKSVVFNALPPVVKRLGVVGFVGVGAGSSSAAERELFAGQQNPDGGAGKRPEIDPEQAGFEGIAKVGDPIVGMLFGKGLVTFRESAADDAEGLSVDVVGEVIEKLVVGLDEDGGVTERGEAAGGVAEVSVFFAIGVFHSWTGEANESAKLFAAFARLVNGLRGGEVVELVNGSGKLLAGNAAELGLSGVIEAKTEHGLTERCGAKVGGGVGVTFC